MPRALRHRPRSARLRAASSARGGRAGGARQLSGRAVQRPPTVQSQVGTFLKSAQSPDS
eukprot:CAMPEP_0179269884 /NCGR_PEP_ID=MMETSP0797-20121207/31185_1 /TAXON_ID=47934 /ORGANISM="Dinophysis acuminata, Strain DAEP01" /LENGTH=58 /DNA_ID=CAMNT_0020978209 /DNA_START=80 /DNA_END=256 /DNA_ORIENTATION=-